MNIKEADEWQPRANLRQTLCCSALPGGLLMREQRPAGVLSNGASS